MIIRDLEYYENGSLVDYIDEIEGGLAITLFNANAVAFGRNVIQASTFDAVTQSGPISVSGFSFFYQAQAQEEPIVVDSGSRSR